MIPIIIAVVILLSLVYFVFGRNELVADSPVCQEYNFTVVLAPRQEFVDATILVRVGLNHVLKKNANGTVVFGFDQHVRLDGVRIRTQGGKEYSYGPQKLGTSLYVDTMTNFEMNPLVNSCNK